MYNANSFNKILPLSCIAIVSGLMVTSCNNSGKSSTTETQTTTTETIQQQPVPDSVALQNDWEQFKQDANARISQAQDSIDMYKKRIAKADKKLKAKYERRVDELEAQNAALRNKLADYKQLSKDKWEEFKLDFNREMDKLKVELSDTTGNY